MAQVIDMTGKVALVTGAASGLGRAAALRLAEAGASLALVDSNAAGLAESAGLIPATDGREVFVHVADLSDPDACTGAVAATVERFGRLDALCNIAGLIRTALSHEMSHSEAQLMMAVNLAAPWYLSQAAIPHLLEVNGAIVNCASCAAFIGQAYCTIYGATKAGLVSMTKSLAVEYSHHPLRVNAVAPGGMDTNLVKTITFPEKGDPTLIARFVGLRGSVEVDDVAEAIAMLASPAGRSYHGSVISIDAGITAG